MKARTICITSGKGGVGKTTVTSNLSAALATLGFSVTAVDGNFTAPNLGLHLGIYMTSSTLHSILAGENYLKSAIFFHPSGFKVVPGEISLSNLSKAKFSKFPEIIDELKYTNDFVIVDSSPGLGLETQVVINSVDKVLIVTNPEATAIADALRTIHYAEYFDKEILGVVVNRVKRFSNQYSLKKIEEILGYPVLVSIPEDKRIQKSIANKTPIVISHPNSLPAVRFFELASLISGYRYIPKLSFWEKFISFVKW